MILKLPGVSILRFYFNLFPFSLYYIIMKNKIFRLTSVWSKCVYNVLTSVQNLRKCPWPIRLIRQNSISIGVYVIVAYIFDIETQNEHIVDLIRTLLLPDYGAPKPMVLFILYINGKYDCDDVIRYWYTIHYIMLLRSLLYCNSTQLYAT